MSTPAMAIVGQNDQATVQGFAAKVRAKFPGAYDDLDDVTLSQKVVAKHPEYSDMLPKSFGTAPVAPVPLPGAGKKILGGTFPSPLDTTENAKMGLAPNEQPLAAPLAPVAMGYLSTPQFIGGLVGGYAGSKGVGLITDNVTAQDVGGIAGSLLGTGAAAQLEDLVPNVKGSLGRNLRVQPTVENTNPSTGTLGREKSFSTLKPGVRAIASAGRIVGGPQIANALIPDYPEAIGPFSRLASKPAPRLQAPVDPVAEAVKARAAAWLPTRMPTPETPVDLVAEAVKARTAAWLPTRLPKPASLEEPIDPVAVAVKARTAAWLPTRVKPTPVPETISLADALMNQGISSSPTSVQGMPPVQVPTESAVELGPITRTGPEPVIKVRGVKPAAKGRIIEPGTPEAEAPHVEGSYWSFREPQLRRAVLSGDRDAAMVYKERFGELPAGSRYVTDVGDRPNRGLYQSRK